MENSMIRESSPESTFNSFAYQFNNTIEGTVIRHLRSYGQTTLHILIEIVINNKNLRNKYSKRYRNQNIEKLTLSKLVAKQHIFIENQNGIWTLDENAATEYEQKKISEIKEIKEKKHELKAKQNKKDKNKENEEEKFKIFNELIDMDIFVKLEQLEEILESSNESAQKQIFEFFKPLSISNIISNS